MWIDLPWGVAGSDGPPPGAAEQRVWLDEGVALLHRGAHTRALRVLRTLTREPVTPSLRAEAHLHLAVLCRKIGAWRDALSAARKATQIAIAAGLDVLAAEALNAELGVHVQQGDAVAAERVAAEALARTTDARVRGLVLQNLGVLAAEARDFDVANRRFAEAAACFREAQYLRGEAFSLTNAAAVAIECGAPEEARALAEKATQVAHRAGDADLAHVAMRNEGEALLRLGLWAEAEARATEALTFFRASGNAARQAECLLLLGDVCRQRGDAPDVARHYYELARSKAEQVQAPALTARIARALAALNGMAA